ncbi:MAG: [protein-PII] uridylyltransferase [Janthinobacterium lividum]
MSLALQSPATSTQPEISGLDRVRLDADISRSRAEHSDDAAFRRAAVDRFRAALDDGRATILNRFAEDHGGLVCAFRLAALEDEIIRSVYDYVVRYVYPLERPSTAERLCVVAVGGYGRATLAPGSDIDLLFLLPSKQTPWGESVVEAMLYVLWDLRQKVGHSTRSVDECVRQAKADMTVRTALLEARFILGDAALFDDLQVRFDRDVQAKTAREFVAAKLAERETRIGRAGASRYLVEPNVKESKGGLRDLNTLFWIAKYAYRVANPEALVGAGLFTAKEFRLFCRCEEFLWRVRCELHIVSGRAEERLSFDYQRRIAARLGYGSGASLSGVERFMKHYFLVAKNVGDLTAIVCAAIEEREARQPAVLDRFVEGLRRRSRVIAGTSDFKVEFDRITVARRDVFERDPVNMIRLFAIADLYDLPIHPDATRLVTLSLRRVDRTLRESPEANRLFMELLTSRRAPEKALRRMNEAGVLGRFIPEFGRIVALMQFNMYHHYTVDEHLLRAVGILAEIDAGRSREAHPMANELMPTVEGRSALYLAVFLHDVAKGRQEDHSLAGAALARQLSPRFGLSDEDTELAAWLVEHHLAMSNTAQSRDLNDRRTIETFAGVAQTPEQLKCLMILTICDIKAVGPGVWNGWKGQLLRTLYTETELLLSGESPEFDRNARVLAAQDLLRPALPEFPDNEFHAYVARHYAPYWLRTSLANRIRDARLIRTLWQDGEGFASDVATDKFRSVTELTIVAPDHPRLLSTIAGACASAGGNIVDAQIYTTKDGLALDSVSVSRAFDDDADELRRAGRIASGIERALRGQIRLGELVAAKDTPPKARTTFALHPKIIVDNAASRRHTVLQVSGMDRPGLLYDLTRALAGLSLNIASAHIATFGEKAVDSFYVSDLTGAKITDPARQEVIRRVLGETFERSLDREAAKIAQGTGA